MVSLLEKQIRTQIAKGFKGKLTLGTLRRATAATLDSYGDPSAPSTVDYSFEGVRSTFTARYKAQSGIPDTDISILILLGSLSDQTITPKQDDKIYMKAPWNTWYQVRKVLEIDPAGASATLQAYEIPTP